MANVITTLLACVGIVTLAALGGVLVVWLRDHLEGEN